MENEFLCGDQVRIVDSGGVYDKYVQFAKKHDVQNWAHGMSLRGKDKKDIYTVILTAPHNNRQSKRMLAVIRDNITGWQYIMNCESVGLIHHATILEDELFEI
jgi:hypothetical protein